MIWLSWRQFRLQALIAAVAVVAVTVVLAVTGPRLAHLTGVVYDQLTAGDRRLYWTGVILTAIAPALLGAFWGAPLVARELESGTYRLAWSQSVTRTRWLAAKLGPAVLGAGAVAGLLTYGVTWWSIPLDGVQSDARGSLPARLGPVPFGMRGLVPVGYAVLAVVLGVLAGLLLRRSVAAMAVTLAVVAFAQIAVPLWVRPHLAPPLHRTVVLSTQTMDGIRSRDDATLLTARGLQPGDWVLTNRTVDRAGRPVAGAPAWFAQCLPPPTADGPSAAAPGKSALDACFARLAAEGYRQQLVYQPADRFWRLQWTETAVLLALSGALAGAAFWWVRRV